MLTKLLLTIAGSALLVDAARADTYYTIDVTSDVLYKINVVTGVATSVGPLGADLDGVDMAWHQGALYAKTFGTSAGNRIYQVLTTGMFAGSGLPGAAFNGGGYQGAEIAGLASNGATLFVTYSNQAPVNFFSTNFGSVNPLTGTITALNTLATDADNMSFVAGQFWSIDVIAPGSGYDLYRGATSPSTFVGNDTYDVTLDTNPVDTELYGGNWLVAVSQTGKKLVLVNRLTGARGTVTPITGTGLPANFFMKGIAREPNPCARVFQIPTH